MTLAVQRKHVRINIQISGKTRDKLAEVASLQGKKISALVRESIEEKISHIERELFEEKMKTAYKGLSEENVAYPRISNMLTRKTWPERGTKHDADGSETR